MIRLNDILKEIGGGSSGVYPYSLDKENVDVGPSNRKTYAAYSFKSDENEYEVLLRDDGVDGIGVGFKIKGGMYRDLTGEGKPLKIINTVVNVVKDFYERNKEIFTDGPYEVFTISASGKTDDAKKRERLYKTFIKRQFPRAKINSEPELITVKVS